MGMDEQEDSRTALEEEERRSSSSSSTRNSTSTYQYEHEPYETYQHKIVSLSHSIARCKDVKLQRLRGGSFNRVVIVRLIQGRPEKRGILGAWRLLAGLFGRNVEVRGIFRIPRFSLLDREVNESGQKVTVDQEIQDQAAVMQLLASTDVPTPNLLAFDATAGNVIQYPYVLQTCSDGVALQELYEGMSFVEKRSIARELVQVFCSAERIKFPRCGTLVAADRASIATSGSYLFASQGPRLSTEVQPIVEEATSSPIHNLHDVLARQLDIQIKENQTLNRGDWCVDMLQRLLQILDEMRAQHIFELKNKSSVSLTESVLYHWDIAPRNMLVKRAPNGNDWTIDMIIDWDKVLTVPAALARQPVSWIWDFSDDVGNPSIRSDYDDDPDLLDPDRYKDGNGRLSADDQRLRAFFEDELAKGLAQVHKRYDREAYIEEAYGKGRWIRRFARLAKDGVHSDWDLKRFKHFDKDWSAYVESLGD